MNFELVEVSQVYSLRHKILRPNQPISSCHFLEDKQDTAFHMAAIDNSKEIIGISSFYQEQLNVLSSLKAFRLRGMAVDNPYQGQCIGEQLLTAAIEVCKNRSADLLWCNARTGAMSFYRKLGFKVKGEAFDIAGIGEHYLMYLSLKA